MINPSFEREKKSSTILPSYQINYIKSFITCIYMYIANGA